MASDFWRTMSMQHWPDEVRRLAGGAVLRDPLPLLRPFAEGETLVETLGLESVETYREAWSDLARRALEPNPFLEPDFAILAALHLPVAQRPQFVMVWQGAGFDQRARLIGLLAVEQAPGGTLFGAGRSWRYRHGALGTPLIDRFASARAMDAMLKWLSQRRPRKSAFIIQPIVRDAPVFDLLVGRCAIHGYPWTALEEHERAVLYPGQSGAEKVARARSTKHRREIDRLRRRLTDHGVVTFRSATTPEDVKQAAEQFLALEHCGWKGKRGTAFLSDSGDATFLRATLRLLAKQRKCRIDWLALDGRPIAMAVLLLSNDRAYFWKTAYDEAFAHFSPGVQLARQMIEGQLSDPTITLTDSCAIADHPMIDRIWPDRQPMVEMMIGLDPARANRLYAFERREKLRRGVREAIKNVANRALGRRAS